MVDISSLCSEVDACVTCGSFSDARYKKLSMQLLCYIAQSMASVDAGADFEIVRASTDGRLLKYDVINNVLTELDGSAISDGAVATDKDYEVVCASTDGRPLRYDGATSALTELDGSAISDGAVAVKCASDTVSASSNVIYDVLVAMETRGGFNGFTIGYSVSGGPVSGVASYGDYTYSLFSPGADSVRQFDSDGVYTGWSFPVSAQITNGGGLLWDGAYFWGIDYTQGKAFRYDAAGVYTSVFIDFITLGIGGVNQIYGMAWDGTHYWAVNNATGEVHQLDSSYAVTGVSFFTTGQDSSPHGITWDGTHFWIVGTDSNKIYKYDYQGVYTGVYFVIDHGVIDARDIAYVPRDDTLILADYVWDVTYSVFGYDFPVEVDYRSIKQVDTLAFDGTLETSYIDLAGDAYIPEGTLYADLPEIAEKPLLVNQLGQQLTATATLALSTIDVDILHVTVRGLLGTDTFSISYDNGSTWVGPMSGSQTIGVVGDGSLLGNKANIQIRSDVGAALVDIVEWVRSF